MRLLVCWVGKTDLLAATQEESVGLGPLAQALTERPFDEVLLLNNFPEKDFESYVDWLRSKTTARITAHHKRLTSPTNFSEIYDAAVTAVTNVINDHGDSLRLTFHLSPGTPAMAAVWIILGNTRFPAELIESSKERGVATVKLPFEISADIIPDLLAEPDDELRRLSAGLPPEAPEFSDIVHRSNVMKRLIVRARRVAPRNIPVLIQGESGTGKELLARAIHRASPRREKPFIAVNCGAIPSELVESTLFGHEKGAFTGAITRNLGLFRKADRGTLFLDEAGELPLSDQVKLLRAIQEGEITPLGGDTTRVDVRVLAATNRDLAADMTKGRFREDLFFRLAVAVLSVPPLRERKGDMSLLIENFIAQINSESSDEPSWQNKNISASARNLLLQQAWPGNVRELLNTLRRAAIWSSATTIGVTEVRESLFRRTSSESSILGRALGEGFDIREVMTRVARHYLLRAMEDANGNKTAAAQLLGLPSYQTLTNWLKKYGVKA